MNNVVSFETAKRLKETGFPQPEPAEGQLWYDEYGILALVLSRRPHWSHPDLVPDTVKLLDLHPGRYLTKEVLPDYLAVRGYVFAPIATDILKNTHEKESDTPMLVHESECWAAYLNAEYYESEVPHGQHVNPAEACAGMWLNTNDRYKL